MIENIINQISPLFPEGAEFRTDDDQPNLIAISWKPNDDPDRPNKRSKIIRVEISDEFAEDYSDGDDRTKQAMMARVPAFVGAKLQDFDPRHNVPVTESPPVETWVLRS